MKKEAIQVYNPYEDLTTQEYLGLLQCLNDDYLEIIRNKLKSLPLPTLNSNTAIIAVGSDGKRERHPRSNTELVIVSSVPSDTSIEIANLLNNYSEEIHLDNLKAGGTEIKTLDEQLSYYKGQKNIVYPDRILNAVLIGGNPDLLLQAREQVLTEMVKSGSIRKKLKGQLHEYLKAANTGIYRKQHAFLMSENIQLYLENNDGLITGFKIPFLRAVQRLADMLTIELLKDSKMSCEEAASYLPTVTVDRLELFSNYGYLQNCSQLIEAYTWFLQNYHYIQENNKKHPNRMSIQKYDPDKFREYSQTIIAAINDFYHLY